MDKGRKLLSELKLYSDYMKWNSDLDRYETWEEACEDVLKVHLTKYGEKVKPLIEEVLPYYKDRAVLASQRMLQFRNERILKHNTKLYNCCFGYVYSPDVFKKGFYVLLSGCGLGISLLNKFVSKMPNLHKREGETITFIIEDSIEGWSDAVNALISSYCLHPSLDASYFGKKIRFDYSLIRPEGSFISGGYKAPGSKGLKTALERIESFIESQFSEKSEIVFRSYIAYNIFMHISDAVLSGGIRRSAMLVIMDKDDEEMVLAKTGNWRQHNPHFARSNNSVGLIKGKFSKEEFESLLKLNTGDNDCGFILQTNENEGFNPCVSEDSLIHTPDGLFLPENLSENKSIILGGVTFKSKPFIKTGLQPTLEIKTDSGRKVRVTKNHLIPTNNNSTFLPAESLLVGDELIISCNEDKEVLIDSNTDDFKKGYLVGSFLGDGNFSGESCQLKFWGDKKEDYHKKCISFAKDLNWRSEKKNASPSNENCPHTTFQSRELYKFIISKDPSIKGDKRLTKRLLEGSFNYISGIISGYFDADGTVLINKIKGNSLRITSSQLENLENLQIGLNALGVYSKIYNGRNKCLKGQSLLPDGKGGKKLYKVKESHELTISKKSIERFYKNVPFINESKKLKVETILNSYKRDYNKTSYIEKIVEITPHTSEFVWDCEVESGVEMFECNGITVHNCVEIKFNFYDKITNFDDTVFQMCNLCEINGSYSKNRNGTLDKAKFLKQCRVASIIGTLQAGFTDMPYLGAQTEEIIKGEALLGVSITGWMDNPALFDKELLKEGAEVVKSTNKEVAQLLGINQAARTTCTKPSGNASVILGTASGIHPEHSKRYFRIMQMNKESQVSKWLKEHYPSMLEESVWSANNTDYVVLVPIENDGHGLYKDSLKDIDHLSKISLVQNSWVSEGKNRDLCYEKEGNHNVSNTVLIDNYQDIVDYIFEHQKDFTAVSFLSRFGDKDFNQAPFTSVLDEKELLATYGKGVIFTSGLIVDGLNCFNNNLWQACDLVLKRDIDLFGTASQQVLQKDWIRRAKKFAKTYFNNDLRTTIYCIKDVHLFHKWNTINREFKNIPDLSKILPKPDYIEVNTLGAVACAGGACSL